MIIIGEKINGSIPSVAEAIANRDAEFIKQRALAQANSGASYIDCCASVPEAEEVETLKWMIDCIQEVTDLPISVDSPSADVLTEAYKFCRKPGIFNSVSGEGDKIDKIFPLMAQPENKGWQVIALLSDDTGIPKSAEDRLKVFDKIMAKAKEYGISPDRIHIDPLVEMLCTSEDGIAMNVEVISSVRKQYPMIHITAAISNISFNLPVRKLINFGFVVRAMKKGVEVLKPHLASGATGSMGKLIIATVAGDLHDIGKNLVAMMIESAGFEVIDLGVDVPASKVIECYKENPDVKVIALSALLTTTMPALKDTVAALNAEDFRSNVKIMVGGAPITKEFADEIGADGYSEDAASAAVLAKALAA